jgi:hypothetical protein
MLEDGKTTTRLPYGDRINGVLHLFGLKNILKGKTVAPWFYAHPLIKYLAEDNYYSKPAYLDASNFSKVIIDLLKGFGQPESQTIQSIHNSITAGIIHKLPIHFSDQANPAIKVLRTENSNLPDPSILNLETVSLNRNTALFLRSLWQDSGADINIFRQKLEKWFDDTMERATGWYKKYTRFVLLIIGFIMAYIFNVDTIAIHRILSTNKPARDQLVQMAIKNKDNLDPDNFKSDNDSILKATYKMVAKDANDANDILGLGTPWRDTSSMCKDSLKCGSFIARFESLEKTHNNIADSINILNSILGSYSSDLDSLSKITGPDTTDAKIKIKDLKRIIAADSVLLKGYQSYTLSEYDRMQKLKERCEFIKDKRAHKWNLYSPNQRGGWETFLGWIITALAITLGAPFWFDLLSKLISVRGAGTVAAPGDDDTPKTKNTATPPSSVNVTVNPNSGEEAVG